MKRSIFLPVIFSLSLFCPYSQKIEANVKATVSAIGAFIFVGTMINNLGRSLPKNTPQKDMMVSLGMAGGAIAAIVTYKALSKENK